MSERTEDVTLERFAAQVQGQMQRLMGALAIGDKDKATQIAGSLCTRAAQIANRDGRRDEAPTPHSYNLKTLRASVGKTSPQEEDDDEDNPFAEE